MNFPEPGRDGVVLCCGVLVDAGGVADDRGAAGVVVVAGPG